MENYPNNQPEFDVETASSSYEVNNSGELIAYSPPQNDNLIPNLPELACEHYLQRPLSGALVVLQDESFVENNPNNQHEFDVEIASPLLN